MHINITCKTSGGKNNFNLQTLFVKKIIAYFRPFF